MSKKDLQEVLATMTSDVKTTYSNEVEAVVDVAEQQYMDGFYLLNLIQLDENQNVIARFKGVIGKAVSEGVTQLLADNELTSLVGCKVEINGRAMFSANQDFSIFISKLEMVDRNGANSTAVKAIIEGLQEKGELEMNRQLPTTAPSSLHVIYHASQQNLSTVTGLKELTGALTGIEIHLHPVNLKKGKGVLDEDIVGILKAIHSDEEADSIAFVAQDIDMVDALNLNKPKIVRSFARIGKPVYTVISSEHDVALHQVSKVNFKNVKELFGSVFSHNLDSLSDELVKVQVIYEMSQGNVKGEYKRSLSSICSEVKAVVMNQKTHNNNTEIKGADASDYRDELRSEYKSILGNICTDIKLTIDESVLVNNELDSIEDREAGVTIEKPDYAKSFRKNVNEISEALTLVVNKAKVPNHADKASSQAIMEQNYTKARFKDTLGAIRQEITVLGHKESDYGLNRAEVYSIQSSDIRGSVRAEHKVNIQFLAAHLRGLTQFSTETTSQLLTEKANVGKTVSAKTFDKYERTVDAIHLPEGEINLTSMSGDELGLETIEKGDEIILSSQNNSSRIVVIESNYKSKKGNQK